MPDEGGPIKEEDLADVKLEHKAETVERKGEMKPAFKCGKCGETVDYPTHCGVQMDLEGDQLKCSSCGETAPVPTHCGEPMSPAIVHV
jgi:primosomal protein N'